MTYLKIDHLILVELVNVVLLFFYHSILHCVLSVNPCFQSSSKRCMKEGIMLILCIIRLIYHGGMNIDQKYCTQFQNIPSICNKIVDIQQQLLI